ncbi:MAG: serine--tRNA ligase [Acidobacteria bacterium]|nr:serine--tRNA ligase [Acidobacteriota bacterium]
MLDLSYVTEHLDQVQEKLRSRGEGQPLDGFKRLADQRRATIREMEDLRYRRNQASEEIGRRKKSGEDAGELMGDMKAIADRIKILEVSVKQVEESLRSTLAGLPNLPHETVPVGTDESSNREVRRVGEPTRLNFPARDHVELGSNLGILDMERASKLAGARFALYMGLGARLERALINFMLDVHTKEHGYQEVLPPVLVNSTTLFGTGQLPKFEGDLFKVTGTDYYLIPTAEVPVTNLYRDEILEGSRLPINLTAYTLCFRSEAGSYGKDVRGLIRQHQFNKVELVKFTRPEDSYQELEKLTLDAEDILKRLELPYRVAVLCTGDMGFSAAKTYDIEVWLPSQNRYREISSCSNCEDFQARRAHIRYRPGPGAKARLVHTLNGSGLAVGRTWIALLENGQQEDGSVVIPSALRPYLDGLERLTPGP